MAMYRITCTVQVPVYQPNNHAHIVEVGTGDEKGYSLLWTLPEVFSAMDSGDTFYTSSPSTGKSAWVHKVACPICGYRYILRSAPDAIFDNNLDALPRCQK
ncbi:MAG TPA: DUF3892 domain-containing protein [Acidiphilium sp.]|nr:DUF3892 domain-containing protein [Acidiphilium sp.]